MKARPEREEETCSGGWSTTSLLGLAPSGGHHGSLHVRSPDSDQFQIKYIENIHEQILITYANHSLQDIVALAGVGVASIPKSRWRPSLQRHSDRLLLGPHIRHLFRQVTPNPSRERHLAAFITYIAIRFGTEPSRYVVRVGASERSLTPERVVVHKKFKGQSGGHDLALLKLPGAQKGQCFTFDPHVNAACLPDDDHGSMPAACVVLVTARWSTSGGSIGDDVESSCRKPTFTSSSDKKKKVVAGQMWPIGSS